MPLATTLRSLVDANRRHWPLEIVVLTDFFPEPIRHQVIGSLPAGSANLRWAEIDLSPYSGLSVKSHMSAMTFARLQVPEVFAGTVNRVLYLDTDILVLGDVGELLNTDLGEAPVAAVRDEYVDARLKAAQFDRLAGVPRVRDYFNAGVLLINPRLCREKRLFQVALAYQETHPRSPYCDQDGLNVACDGLWRELEGKWNYQTHRTVNVAGLHVAKRPHIVHFITGDKPWKPSSTGPNARLYNDFRKRTLFALSRSELVAFAANKLTHRVKRKLLRVARSFQR